MTKKKAKILLVDDEQSILTSLGSALEDEGYEVSGARSGESALKLLEKKQFDCILVDIWLPGMDGIQLLEKIKEQGIETPVVIISGHGTIESAVRATKLGAYDFLEKPLNLEKVILTIEHALELSHLSREYQRLKKELIEEEELTGVSKPIQELKATIEKIAPSEGWVLIQGENGTGKEVVAKAIHKKSLRKDAPFVAVNCAAIPSELIESELFGYEKGAFTGAETQRPGKFELADGGTLFFDEIGDMSPATQAKVLRVLQEQEFNRLGGSEPIRVDVRVIAATNKDLEQEIEKGNFRQDLYYRLNVIPIYIPPLRERKEDIPELVNHFLEVFCQKSRLRKKQIHPQVLEALMEYDWPGNVRELKNIVERMVILSSGDEITLKDLPPAIFYPKKALAMEASTQMELKQAKEVFERQFILQRLLEHNYNITLTAQSLGLDRTSLYRKMKKLGIEPEAQAKNQNQISESKSSPKEKSRKAKSQD